MRDRVHEMLGAVSALAALLYLSGLFVQHLVVHVGLKAVPALALALAAARHGTALSRTLSIGLLLSAGGDILLSWPGDTFVPGLGLFLAAHAVYIVGLSRSVGYLRIGWAAPFAVWGVVVLAGLWEGLGPVAGPVTVYVGVICTMMWRAGVRATVLSHPMAWLGFFGAISFGLSDTLIAIHRFGTPLPADRLLIMATYWLGQLGITAGAWAPDDIEPTPETP